MIAVERPGLLTTVQDAGRPGYRAFGMAAAGPMDRYAFAAANLLAGNPPGAAALEMTLQGGAFLFEGDGYAAVAGADMGGRLDGEPLAPWSGVPVRAGSRLAFSAAATGCRTYLAVQGGIDVPPVMGSRSTDLRAGVGGLAGRALAAGDRLPAGQAERPPPPRALPRRLVPRPGRVVTLRVLPGPQEDLFAPEGIEAFYGAVFAITGRNDRMGYRLDGPPIRHRSGPDIVSDAILPGAVQVPGDQRPIVMAVDGQTVGGYAKIGHVVGADLALLAQARQGDRVRFRRVSEAEAVAALRAERRALRAMAEALAGGRRRGAGR